MASNNNNNNINNNYIIFCSFIYSSIKYYIIKYNNSFNYTILSNVQIQKQQLLIFKNKLKSIKKMSIFPLLFYTMFKT